MTAIFHVVDRQTWHTAVARGEYQPASLRSEGFVHCSFADQLPGTLRRHFAGVPDLLVLELDASRFHDVLRVEDTTGDGESFPHLYGPVPIDAVVAEHHEPAADGPGSGLQ